MTTPDSTSRGPHAALMDLDADALRCPFPHYAAIREESPLYFVPELRSYMVTRYEDIVQVLTNPLIFSSLMPTGPKFQEVRDGDNVEPITDNVDDLVAGSISFEGQRALLNADPPLHDRQRRLVNRAFTPRRVALLEDDVREFANRLVDGFQADGRVNLVERYAAPIPLHVTCRMLGVTEEEQGTFRRWADAFTAGTGNHRVTNAQLAAQKAAEAEFREFFAHRIEERRKHPQDDLISDVVHARIDGEELNRAEMLGMFSQFLVAGQLTTKKLITGAMKLLLEHPEQHDRVLADHSLIPSFIEEALRFETPSLGTFRLVTKDTEVGGQFVPAGTHLMVMLAAGNHDESRFPGPEAFDISREEARHHLAFSQGPHYCLGAPLARMEARVAFDVLLDRLRNLRLAPENTYEYQDSYMLHGLLELIVEFDAVA